LSAIVSRPDLDVARLAPRSRPELWDEDLLAFGSAIRFPVCRRARKSAPIEPTTSLKPGSKGAEVRAPQQPLAGLGYSPGKLDGNYGPATQKALESFQRASKLSPDGILGPKTLAALKKALRQSG
jgi:peptidoglycan hydrolase-like protein with peptidoglycan-binding domain